MPWTDGFQGEAKGKLVVCSNQDNLLWKLVVWFPGLHGYFHFDTMAAVALCHSVGSVSVLIQGIYQWLPPNQSYWLCLSTETRLGWLTV